MGSDYDEFFRDPPVFGSPGGTLERVLRVLVVAYFAAVTLGVIVDIEDRSFASSPAGIADGKVWRLLTSALAVNGPFPLAQVALAALVSYAVVRYAGAVAWWGAALSAQVGSALVVYAGIGILDALGVEGAARAGDDPDYGTSVVLAGSLGALLATAVRHQRRGAAILTGLTLLVFLPFSLGWYGLEHFFGFAFGAAFTAWWERRDGG